MKSLQSEGCEALLKAFHYILLIAEVDDKEIFKVCMEYFEFLGKSLYEERCASDIARPATNHTA